MQAFFGIFLPRFYAGQKPNPPSPFFEKERRPNTRVTSKTSGKQPDRRNDWPLAYLSPQKTIEDEGDGSSECGLNPTLK
jgi:hypothetical protein